MSEQHKIAAAKRGADKTAKLNQKVDEAMRTISAEMQANGGIYPHNHEFVGLAEVARRAEINEATFHKKNEANIALKERVTLWLDTLKKKETVGRMRVRKTFQQRAENWKERHDALETRHAISELQLQQAQAQLEALQLKYDALLEQMNKGAAGKVTPITKGKH
jgi:hypothetical protein